MKSSLFAGFFVLALMAFMPDSPRAADKIVTIGTGGVTGVYYPAGGAICRLVNRGRKEHGIRCSVESTGGSIYNLNALGQGELELAIAQTDWLYHAYDGTGVFTGQGPNPKLRSLFSLHSEPFTVVVRSDSGIKTFDELKGPRLNIGNPGSGMRATIEALMRLKGWDRGSFSKVTEMRAAEQGQALCDNQIDAMVFAAGHPNGSIQEVTNGCDAKLIPVTGPEIDKLIADNPYYAYATIPGGMYKGNSEDVKTFGVRAALVTTSELSDEVAYQIVKAVFENFDSFKTLHFVFATLDRDRMVQAGLTAPLHNGAMRYFKEAGLIK